MQRDKKIIVSFGVSLITLGLGGVAFRQQAMLARAQTAAAPRAPHAIEAEEFVGLVGEAPHLSAKYQFALRGDGSTATVITKYDRSGAVQATDRELRLAGGVRADVSDHLKVVSATQSRVPNAAALRNSEIWDPVANCRATRDRAISRSAPPESGEDILGFHTVTFTEDSSAMRLKRWLAPALGCAELRQIAEFKDARGEVASTSERRAVRAEASEPDKALFDWASDYEYVSPSERYLRAVTHCKCGVNYDTLTALKAEDKVYLENRYTR